ncbi:amidohydrolase family protein [Conexibacter arvalis]|uniref:Amidohydrolase 3 domain-containing protein n=1 Tax=Conexibacter arvalis TaxID=912552 RepID=A0A840I8X1_9ACTN|nr:hypothetical protein [Conexibacter arvalis]
MSADLAIVGATVRTLDPSRPHATAVACRDGRVVAVGDDAEIRACCDARTELLDGAGRHVVPGLVDAHVHPFFVEQTRGVDLTACTSLMELRDALCEGARDPSGWVLGWGLSYEAFEGRPLDGALLDEVVGDAPALVTFMDQHTALASRRALEIAGVTGAERFEQAAEVATRDGLPTGELREFAAIALVRDVVPELGDGERRRLAAQALERLSAQGLTGAHLMDGSPETFALLRELEATAPLPVRLVVPLWQTPETTRDEMLAQLPLVGERGVRWRGGTAKFYLDGVVESGTAWLGAPDACGDGGQPFWPEPQAYAAAVRLFAEAGFQCATHAVGDRAVRAVLDAYRGLPRPGAPHRVEHIEVLDPADLPRFAAEGVAASMQPLHMQWRREDGGDQWAARLGRERTERGFPARSIAETGAIVALGSDWPVASSDPRVGMAWSRLRRQPGAIGAAPFEPHERLTPEQALAGYTTAAAAIAGEADVAGRIAVGRRADLTVLGADPVDCPADELPDVPVLATIVAGAAAYRGG